MTEFIDKLFPIMVTYTNISPIEFYDMTPIELLTLLDSFKEKRKQEIEMKKSELEITRLAVTMGIANTRKGNKYTLFEDVSKKHQGTIEPYEKKRQLEYLQSIMEVT